MDMLLIMFFMSLIMPIMGMLAMPPPIMPMPPCGAALADGLGAAPDLRELIFRCPGVGMVVFGRGLRPGRNRKCRDGESRRHRQARHGLSPVAEGSAFSG